MNHCAWNLYLIVFTLLLALPRFAAAAQTHPRSVLAGVPGLERRLTYAETKIPLGELVQKVATETGVRLTATADVADEPVAVVIKDRPARDLLEELADLLDYRWSRRGSNTLLGATAAPAGGPYLIRSNTLLGATAAPAGGPFLTRKKNAWRYELWQDLGGRQREEVLRQALRARVEQRFREELQTAQEMAGLSQEEMRRLWDAREGQEKRQYRLMPEEREALHNSPEEKERDRRLDFAQRLWSPIARSLAGFVGRLTPEQWTALRAGRQIVFASDPKPGELPLPEDVLRTFRTSQPSDMPPDTTWLSENPEVEEQNRRHERAMQERWVAADGYHVTIRFTPNFPHAGWIVFNAITSPVRSGERQGARGENPLFVLNISPEHVQPREPQDPQRRARLEADPILGAKKPFRPEAEPRTEPPPLPRSRPLRTLQDLLPDLARAYGVDFIADSYWRSPEVEGLPPANEPVPLFLLLDRFTAGHALWDRRPPMTDPSAVPNLKSKIQNPKSDDRVLIRVRSRKWFLDRPGEIPLRSVRRWVQLVDRRGALSLEEYASLASHLTEPQIESLRGLVMQGVFPPQLQDLQNVSDARHLLRLYAALSPAQREALQRGARLPVSQTPPRLRPLILATLNQIGRMRYPLMDLQRWTAGSLSLADEPQVRVREERGGAVSFRLLPPQTPGAEQAPAEPRRDLPRLPGPPVLTRRYPVMSLKLQIAFGLEKPESVELVVAPPARERSSVIRASRAPVTGDYPTASSRPMRW